MSVQARSYEARDIWSLLRILFLMMSNAASAIVIKGPEDFDG